MTSARDFTPTTLTYSEGDTFAMGSGGLTDAGWFDMNEVATDSPNFFCSSASSAGTAVVTTGQSTVVTFGAGGGIGQLGGVASSAGLLSLGVAATGTTALTAGLMVVGDGGNVTYGISASSTQTANSMFAGSMSNVAGTTTVAGTLNETSSSNGSDNLIVRGVRSGKRFIRGVRPWGQIR
jgi:hypothetical protein